MRERLTLPKSFEAIYARKDDILYVSGKDNSENLASETGEMRVMVEWDKATDRVVSVLIPRFARQVKAICGFGVGVENET